MFNRINNDRDRDRIWNKRKNNKKKIIAIDRTTLRSLTENENVENVLLTIQNSNLGFSELLEIDNEPDVYVLLIKLINNILVKNNKTAIVQLVAKASFFKKLTFYIASIEFQNDQEKRSNTLFWKDPEKFWNDLIKVCERLKEVSPNWAYDTLPKLLKTILKCLPRIEKEHEVIISENITKKCQSLYVFIECKNSEKEKEKKTIVDYRYLNVFPSTTEITSNETVSMKKNKVIGSYEDATEYLDIQFKLLREDFIAPLREDVCRYMAGAHHNINNVTFFDNVQFLKMKLVNECFSYLIEFGSLNMKQRTAVENFMFGSLVCFTQDQFRTVIFGKIVDSDRKLVSARQVIVGFESMVIPNQKPYLMFACGVFFEPYYQVLTALQKIIPSKFPMHKYLINVETIIDRPTYLNTITRFQIDNKLLSELSFASNKVYGLNDSQLAAFKAALTKELAIIQGPPGTGKTFVGLKIVQTLLENSDKWYNDSPILLICLTNHALDQFLEGIIPFTRQILRIGSRSKNEALNEFNINAKRRLFGLKDIRIKLNSIIYAMEQNNNFLNTLDNFDSIISFHVLKITPKCYELWFRKGKNNLRTWLMDPIELARTEENFIHNEWELNNLFFDLNLNNLIDNRIEDVPKLFNLKSMLQTRAGLLKELDKIRRSSPEELNALKIEKMNELEWQLENITREFNYLKYNLELGSKSDNSEQPKVDGYKDPTEIPYALRWQLYFHWVHRYNEKLQMKRLSLSEEYVYFYEEYNNLRSYIDARIMKDHLVIGMTTTGAARLNSTLQMVKPPIVIVEEAAEVLEAHIVSALTEHCEHLILIGDHQQLRPSPADYRMEKEFNLGVSLFERMVLNKVDCHTLSVQHRMRPEISALIAPAIYPDLENHKSVKDRDDIRGVGKNVYFIDHEELEATCSETSKKNTHEAAFLIRLALHLILNGYKPSEVTILAAYKGQMYELMNVQRQHSDLLREVRIDVLDNYQGEECKIILLSLVRSNTTNSIGFLKTDNRVCVALSRARDGLYIMGNMKMLANNSKLWKQIKCTLESQAALGATLPLVCQQHPDNKTLARTANDFDNVPRGGCHLICNFVLPCGHTCKSRCHFLNKDHEMSICKEKCEKLLCDKNPKHICKKMCPENCGPCTYEVVRELNCGHKELIKCHIDPTKYQCTTRVTTTLTCGHDAEKQCHQSDDLVQCPRLCDFQVDTCGHTCVQLCHVRSDPDHKNYKCKERCNKPRIDCSRQPPHRCTKMCFEECLPCTVEVEKQRSDCSHVYNIPCNYVGEPRPCDKPCEKILPCNHKCGGKCGGPCGLCKVIVEKRVPDCNHNVKLLCHQELQIKFCYTCSKKTGAI